ncbi:MAG: ABC transporter permease [Candidatus Obscuribacterales bacterium]|nr:ABC transporter permease [Candidatus Obscuribacterales bacterium]
MFAKEFLRDINKTSLLQCIVFLLAMCLFFALNSSAFISPINLCNILTASSVIGLMAVGATFVIASGCIDLAAASIMALSSVTCAWAAQNLHYDGLALVGIAVATGALCGLTSGFLINFTKAPSFIITLGMLSISRALAFILTGGIPIYGLEERVTKIAEMQWFGLSLPALIMLGGMLVGYLLLTRTRFGAHSLLLGDSQAASEAMGLRVPLLRLAIFVLAGCFSGLAGFIFMARTNSGDPSAGMNYELTVITAVVLGGANLFGGRATIFGTLAGVLCLGVLQNGLNLMAISTFYQTLFIGIVLILASLLRRFGPNNG